MFTQSHQARNEASCSIPLRQHSEMQLRWLSRWAGLCTAWICTEHISPFHTIVCSWQTEIMVAAKTTHLELRRWKDRNLKTNGRASREHEAFFVVLSSLCWVVCSVFTLYYHEHPLSLMRTDAICSKEGKHSKLRRWCQKSRYPLPNLYDHIGCTLMI